VIETIHRVAALRKKLERNDNADERAWPLACAALLISAEGQGRLLPAAACFVETFETADSM
jgi:hypothetical protein